MIGTGGFSIVYRAMDEAARPHRGDQEYFPAAFAQRGRDGTVQPVSREKDTFSTGIVSFTNEGQAAGAVRSPGAGARLSLLGGARHGLSGHAPVRRADAQGRGEEAATWQLDEAAMQALLVPLMRNAGPAARSALLSP